MPLWLLRDNKSSILLVHINGGHGVHLAHALNEDGEFRGQHRNRWRTCSLSEEQLTLLLHNIKVLLQFIQLRCLLLQCSMWKTMIRTMTVSSWICQMIFETQMHALCSVMRCRLCSRSSLSSGVRSCLIRCSSWASRCIRKLRSSEM